MYSVSETINDVFAELQLETGLVPSEFTVSLFKDGTVSLISVSVSEVAGKPGFYSTSFTPDEEGLWSLDIVVNSKPNIRYQSAYQVKNVEEQIAEEILQSPVPAFNVPGTVADYLNKTKKYTSNRVLITGTTYTVKDDDGLTDFETGTITPSERNPS